MATLALTRVTALFADQPIPTAGFHEEFWLVASGGATGDTVTVTPFRGRLVAFIEGGPLSATNNATLAQTSITGTLVGGTLTMGSFLIRATVVD